MLECSHLLPDSNSLWGWWIVILHWWIFTGVGGGVPCLWWWGTCPPFKRRGRNDPLPHNGTSSTLCFNMFDKWMSIGSLLLKPAHGNIVWRTQIDNQDNQNLDPTSRAHMATLSHICVLLHDKSFWRPNFPWKIISVHTLFYPPGGVYFQSYPNSLPHEVGVTHPITTTPSLNLMLKNSATKANYSSGWIFQIQSKILD